MPVISRKEFANLCHGDVKKLNVHVQRKKLTTYAGNVNLLDTENPKNAQYLAAEKAKVGAETVEKPKAEPVKKEPKAKKTEEKPAKPPAETREIREKIARQNAQDMKEMQSKARKDDLDYEIAELKRKQLELQLDKVSGKLLPVDLAEGVIVRHGVTILKEFEKGFIRIAEIFVAITGADPGLRAKIIDDCKQVLHRCVTDAGEKASDEIENLVADYSETLLRGQRKV